MFWLAAGAAAQFGPMCTENQKLAPTILSAEGAETGVEGAEGTETGAGVEIGAGALVGDDVGGLVGDAVGVATGVDVGGVDWGAGAVPGGGIEPWLQTILKYVPLMGIWPPIQHAGLPQVVACTARAKEPSP